MAEVVGYINNYEEALLLVHACRLGLFPLVNKRLDQEQKENIDTGIIFCFVESESGMKRWTDGKIWSPSKICGEFLVYQEVPKHLSKNSLKKRKSLERYHQPDVMTRVESFVDRTTLHKKTISIEYANNHYHIIAYYRPIFVNFSLLDLNFFQRLGEALNIYPILKSDEFVRENLKDPSFYQRYKISTKIESLIMDNGKRVMLEKIAIEVLELLGRRKKMKVM